MTVLDWLSSPGAGGRVVLEYLAELISVNRGDFEIRRLDGVMADATAPYGRFGLSPLEALHLQELRGILLGFMMATGDAYAAEVRMKIQATITGHRQSVLVPTAAEVTTLTRGF